MIKKIGNYSRGMTYVEIIVVLGIFGVLSAVVMFNYGEFQARVDIKNLASDIALKIVEAQKSSLDGKLTTKPITIPDPTQWKPAYGVYLDINAPKQLIYFVDLNQNDRYDGATSPNDETLEIIYITKNNYISWITRCKTYASNDCYYDNSQSISPISIVFKRPNSSPVFKWSSGDPLTGFNYVRITVKSPKGAEALIKIYPSGRIQIN